MGLTSIVMGILTSEGQDIAVDKVKSKTGDVIKRQYSEYELRKKVDSLVNIYCQGLQETLDLEQEFDIEGLQRGSKGLIDSAKECTVGTERELKQIQFFEKGYTLAGVDPKKKNRRLDAILASILNVVLEESGQALTVKAVDEIHEHLSKLATHKDIETVINKLEALSLKQSAEQKGMDFTPYYEFVKKRFTRKKQGEYAKLVGAYSDDEAYIDAFINTGHGAMSALSFLEEWFAQGTYGTLLIYGEPGHGKSMLCNKAMFEHYKGTFLPEAKNVLSVSLNTGVNDKIIKDGTVNIDAILSWNDHPFTFEDCRGALLFMDGFDEFIDLARRTDNTDIFSFMKKIGYKADEYDIHIVVLSRTIAISVALEKGFSIRNKCYELMSITEQQQDDWLDQHSEYIDYKETLSTLRNNTDMSKLLGIPFIFRMIVHTRYDGVSKNTVELYDHLIDHLMEKRDIRGDKLKQVNAELCDLAYEIYCNDTDTVIIDGDKRNSSWMIVFYIKQAENGIYGFFHRSFYQYFLAKYVILHLLNIDTDEHAEEFIGAFAERELDDTVRQYLSLMINENDREIIHKNLKLVIEALVRTEAYLNLKPRYPDGSAEKTKLGRTINIYRNTLHMCAAFSYVIEISFADGIDILMRTYPSHFITICSNEKYKADLSRSNLTRANMLGANLSGSNLSRAALGGIELGGSDLSYSNLEDSNLEKANLSGSCLSFSDLTGADLMDSNMIRANLNGAILKSAHLSMAKLREANVNKANLSSSNLRGADLLEVSLSGAYLIGTDLTGANLRGADLTIANLAGANLSFANLRDANLSGANLRVKSIDHAIIDSDKKELFDPSIEGYETVVWV